MTRVLLLSAGFGDGHRQVARALMRSFSARGVTVREVDCFERTNLRVAKLNQWMYAMLTRYLPFLYGWSYTWTAKLKPTHFLWKIMSVFSRRALVEVLNEFKPDIVLQLFPDHASDNLRLSIEKPYVGVVITDFSVHSHWFHDDVDAYFIANADLGQEMLPFTVSTSTIVESGIPIREQFQSIQPVPQLQSERPYVLVATGGRGLFPDLFKVLTMTLSNLPECDVYVLCGRNDEMLEKVKELAQFNPRLHGLAFEDNVAAWFQNARLSIVKSGGITVSECLASHCPMIFYRPGPGQEADNAEFLEQMGAGKVIRSLTDLCELLESRHFMDEISRMKEACIGLARPNAADDITEYVLKQAESKLRA